MISFSFKNQTVNCNLFVFFILLILFVNDKLMAQSTLYPSPLDAKAGTPVTVDVYGGNINFSGTPAANFVYFGGVRAPVINSTATHITTVVPRGSFYAPITVTNPAGLTAYSWRAYGTTFINNALPRLAPGSFSAAINFPTGNGVASIVSADFNGDGKPDFATANYSDNTLSVFKNISSGGVFAMAPKEDILTGNGPVNLAVADFDGDGKLDLLAVNSSANTVSVFRNTSSEEIISFAARLDFFTGNTPYYCNTNDFDGDGKIDIAVVNRSNDNSVSVLRNTSTIGQVSFASRLNFITGNFPIGIASADLNQDTKPDMAVVNYFSNTVSTFKNVSTPGNIVFEGKVDFTAGAFPISIAIGDVSKDFRQDLVIANTVDNTVSVLKHNIITSNIFFDAKIDFPVASGPVSLALNDLDGDGAIDVVTTSQGTSLISLLRNITDPGVQLPAFEAKLDYATGNGPLQVFAADFDTDGKTDIATVNSNDKTVAVLLSKAGEGAPVINGITPQTATAGEAVTINGKNFTAVNSVIFGGTTASSYSIVNDSTIHAVLGSGGTGRVLVATPSGIAGYSNFIFRYDQGPARIINTVAGNGVAGYGGDGGLAINASFNNLFALSADSAGNVFITDGNNARMRKLNTSTGVVTTIAGNGTPGFSGDGGLATAAQIENYQGGSAFDKSGNFYFADFSNNRVRKVDALTGIISTVAGGGPTNADGILATTASIGARGVAVDVAGNLFIVDNTHNKIRKVNAVTGVISTVAGTGLAGYNGDNIAAINAQLNKPQNLALDKSGNIYIADLLNSRIRKVDIVTGIITTVIGNGTNGWEGDGGPAKNAQINNCWSVALDTTDNIYVAEANGNKVRRVDAITGLITTIAGIGVAGFSGDGGNATTAFLGSPTGIAVDRKQNVYVTDNSNRVRKISFLNSDVTVCPNGIASFTSDVFGTSYKWQFDGGSNGAGFFDISPGDGGFSGVFTPTLTMPIAYTVFNAYKFRCIVNGVAGKTFTLKIAETWNGSVSSAWENAANWNCGVVPDFGTDVVIKSGTVVINSNVRCRSIQVNPAANITVKTGSALTVYH